MKFKKKEMKDALSVIKRLVKDAKTGKMYVEAKGDTRLYLKAVSDDGSCTTYHTIASLDEEVYALCVNPHELDKHLTELENVLKKEVKQFKEQAEKAGMDKKEMREKEKEIRAVHDIVEFRLSTKSISAVNSKANLKIAPIQEDLQFYFTELTDVKRPDAFIALLKEAETALKKNKDVATSYLKLTSEKALAAEEKQIHFFRVDEPLPFKGGYLHKDNVSILAKSLKGAFQMGLKDKEWVLYHDDVYYLIKFEPNVQFPNFRSMTPLGRELLFTVDVDAIQDLLSQYKKTKEKSSAVSELLITQQGNHLHFDPRHEEYPTLTLPVEGVEGQIKRAIFEVDLLRSLFVSYQGNVQVEQQQFKNVYGVVGYMWRVYTPDKLTMIAGIEEPDWEEIDAHFKAGTIQDLYQRAKTN